MELPPRASQGEHGSGCSLCIPCSTCSRCDQDSPKPLLFLFYFGSPFSFGRVQTLLWSLFLFWYFALLAWSLWPGASCFPGSSVLPLWFLLQLLLSPLKPPLSQNWCSLDDLQSLNPPPGLHRLAEVGLGGQCGGRWQQEAPRAAPHMATPSSSKAQDIGMVSPPRLGCHRASPP